MSKQSKAGSGNAFVNWISRNYIYVIAFFIPFTLMYITYALFEVHPYGNNSVLVLDLNGQYVYYFEELRDALWGNGSVLYSWSRNLSGEFLGTIGYYLASPFTIIVMLLPRSMILGSLELMQLCKVGAASVTFCYFLCNSRKLRPLNAMVFSILYSLMAYMVIQLMDPMWIDGPVFLPLIMYGIEKLVDEEKKLNYVIPLAIMFVANFYIGYMTAIFCVLYFIYYVLFGSEKFKYNAKSIFGVCIRFGVCSITAGMCAAFMLLPIYNALKLGKFEFTDPDFSFKLQFSALDLLTKLLPSSYDSVRNEGLPEIYCGMLTVLMLPLFYMNRKISTKEKMGQTFLMAVMFFSMYIKPVDMLWHGGQVPNWLPYRYSFIVSFILLTMAAQAFQHLDGINAGAIGGVFTGVMFYLLYADKQGYENLDTMGAIWFSIACIACFAILCHSYRNSPKSIALPIVMMIVISGELVVSSLETLKDIDKEVTYSKYSSYTPVIKEGRQVVDLMEQYDNSLYRSEKTFHRTVNDSMAYGLKGITHSNSVMNTPVIDFLGKIGYVSRGHYARYNGYTPISDSILGIKYVLDKDDKVDPTYQEVTGIHTGTNVKVYENPNALSIGYMVNSNIQNINIESKNPFENMNDLFGKMTTGEYKQYFKPMQQVAEPRYENVTTGNAGTQTKYVPTVEGKDCYIEYYLESQSDDTIYLYFPCINEKQINIWLSTDYDEEKGEFVNHKFVNYFYETQYYCILKLGQIPKGTKFAVRATIANEYCYMEDQWFYYFDYAAYQNDVNILKQNQWNIEKFNETHLEGTITALDNQIMFTSIPDEGGWTIKVDGQKVEPVKLANCLIGIPMSAGTHKVTMSFFNPGLALGIVLSIAGIIICVVFYMMDSPKDFDEIFRNMGKGKSKKKKEKVKTTPDGKTTETTPTEQETEVSADEEEYEEETDDSDDSEDSADDEDDDADYDDEYNNIDNVDI